MATIPELNLVIATEHANETKHLAALGTGLQDRMAMPETTPIADKQKADLYLATMHDKVRADHQRLGNAMVARGVLEYSTIPDVPPPPPPPPSPNDFGCPDSIDLLDWTYDPNEGAGRPTKDGSHYDIIPDWKTGNAIKVVSFYGLGDTGMQTELGIASGGHDTIDNFTLRDSVVKKVKKWGARVHRARRNNRLINVTFQDGYNEHDIYGELVTNGFTREQNAAVYQRALAGATLTTEEWLRVALYVENVLFLNSASQSWQQCSRERDGLTVADMGEAGLIWLKGGLAINHASETGKGDRRSQCLKFFSWQRGPDEQHNTWSNHLGHVLVEDFTLDDSMQPLSNGGLLIGRNHGTTIRRSSFSFGELIQEAVRIEADTAFAAPFTASQATPCGPTVFDTVNFVAKSGENGRGISIYDLKRPVEFRNCTGNLLIYGPTGQALAKVSEGYKQG
jgi:hypothetical protein